MIFFIFEVIGRRPEMLPVVVLAYAGGLIVAFTLHELSHAVVAYWLGDPTAVSWGSILDDAFSAGAISQGAWWYLVPPGVCVVLVVLAFNLIGRALEDIIDPHTEGA